MRTASCWRIQRLRYDLCMYVYVYICSVYCCMHTSHIGLQPWLFTNNTPHIFLEWEDVSWAESVLVVAQWRKCGNCCLPLACTEDPENKEYLQMNKLNLVQSMVEMQYSTSTYMHPPCRRFLTSINSFATTIPVTMSIGIMHFYYCYHRCYAFSLQVTVGPLITEPLWLINVFESLVVVLH